jgi:hypothetical protein
MWLKQAAEGIPTDSLSVSFNQMYRAYVVYYPGTTNRYITRIAGIEMGFGPRYLLEEKLEAVKAAGYGATIPADVVQFEQIEELKTPLKVLLGKKKYLEMSEDEKEAAILENLQLSDKDDPGRVTGYEDSLKRINDPEKIKVTVI